MSISKDIEIAVIGGGLSGFAVATMLIKHGYKRVIVYERDASIDQRRQGYGLTILQGIAALKALGCFEQVKCVDTPSRSHYIFDSQGNIINFFGTIFWSSQDTVVTTKSKKKYNLHIGRTNLRRIIYDELLKNSGEVKWNHKVNSIREIHEEQKMLIEFANGEQLRADLVIGADGIKSVVRGFKYEVVNDYPLNYLGMIMILGITYVEHSLAQKRVFQTLDGCTRLFAMPYASADGKENFMWQLSFPLCESEAKRLSSDLELLKEHLMERCGDWHEPIPSMIANTSLSLMMGIPAYDREAKLPARQSMGNIVLLGDAAHPMSPFKGQGANQALLDAVSAAKAIANEASVPDAIDVYEREMIGRVKPKVDLSRERVATFHDANILNSDSFEYRGASQILLDKLKADGVNYQSGEEIENLIVREMKFLNLI